MIRQLLLSLLVLIPIQVFSATYTLPADVGTAPFNLCAFGASTVSCSGNVTLGNNDSILITENITLSLGGGFTSGNNLQINNPFAFNFNMSVGGNITIGNGSKIVGNITSGANIDFGNNANITGDITAGSSGTLNFGTGSNVTGSCSATNPTDYNPYCTGSGGTVIDTTGICFDFESGVPAEWTTSGSGEFGTSSQTYQSGLNSLYLRDEAIIVSTGSYNLTNFSSLDITVWIQRGDDSFSEDPDNNEDLLLQYRDPSGNWITLATYIGEDTVGEIFTPTFSISSTEMHNNFAVRFNKIAGNDGNWDYFHVDDLCLTPQIDLPTPVLEYRFDELSWNGTADEVDDESGNNNHATADSTSGTTTSTDAQICQAASFNGVDQLLTATDLSALRSTATMSFWIKTTDSGTDQAWQSPGIAGIEEQGGGDDIFWGWLNASGNIGITVGNDNSAFSSASVNDGNYHHVVLIRDMTNDTYRIFVDGVLSGNGAYTGDGIADVIGNTFDSIGVIEDTGTTPVFLDAEVDELLIFDSVLSDLQIQDIYNKQSAGLNLDGSPRVCNLAPGSLTPYAWFTLDEISSGQYSDDSGNGNNIDTVGAAIAVDETLGKICSANEIGENNDQAIIDGLNTDIVLSTSIGETGAISFWFNSNNDWNAYGDSRILWDASSNNDFFTLQLDSNGRLDFLFEDNSSDDFRFRSNSLNFIANDWHHISVAWDLSASNVQFYIDGSAIATNQITSGFSNWSAYDSLPALNTILFGDGRNSASYNGVDRSANGIMDELYIFDETINSAEALAVFNETHPCPVQPISYHQFEEPSWTGATDELEDETGNGLNLTNVGNSANLTAGRVCTGAFFNGTDGVLSRDHDPVLDDYSAGFASTMWINPTEIPATGRHTLINKDGLFALRLNGAGQLRLNYRDSGNVNQVLTTSGLSISTNSWYHVAVSVSPARQVIWLDGVIVLDNAASTSILTTTSGQFRVGANSSTAPNTVFAGRIDELRLYNQGITQTEVSRDLLANHSCDTSLVGWYHFEEAAYNGADGEVIDYSGNRNNGVSDGASARATGYLCYGATIPRNTSINAQQGIETGVDINNDIGDQGTLMLWYNSDRNWNQGGRKNLIDASTNYAGSANDKFFYLEINGSGRLRFAFEDADDDDDFAVIEPVGTVRQAGDWHHIAITWDFSTVLNTPASNTNYRIYVDGVLVADDVLRENGGFEGPNINGMPNLQRIHLGDNSSGYSVPPGNSASGIVDEFRAYNRRLTAAEILTASAESHPCAGEAIVRYQFEESLWDGTPDEIKDDSGFSYDAVKVGIVNPVAYTSTCKAAFFDHDDASPASIHAIATPMDIDRDIGNEGSIMMWLKPQSNWGAASVERNIFDASRNPRDFYASLLPSGALRFVLTDASSNKFVLTSSTQNFTSDDWVHVAFTWSFAAQRLVMYINGVEETTQVMSGVFNIADLPTLYLGDSQNNRSSGAGTQNSWSGWLEDARIYNYERSDAEVLANYNGFTPCVELLNHFDIDENLNNGLAINCDPEPIAITAKLADNTTATAFTGIVRLEARNTSTNTLVGTWSYSGSNSFTFGGTGIADIELVNGEVGISDLLELSVTDPQTVTINVSYLAVSERSGSANAADDPDITFVQSGFIVSDALNGPSIPRQDMVARTNSSTMYLKAITTDVTTGVCTSLFSGNVDVEMYTSCENPNTCAAGQQIDFTNNSNTTVLNAENQSATPTWQSVTTFFNADSTALFDVNSDDVGVHTHHFRYQLNGAGSTANETLQTSIDYYARPHDIVISSRTNLDGDELDTSNTAKAQEDFYVYLQGVDSSGAAYPSYNDVDMVPGGVTDHHSVTWNTHRLVTPIDGTPELGILTQSNLAAIDTRLRSTMNFSELSRISVGGVVNDYWGVLPAGDFNYTLDEITIGDFVPAYIQVSQIANPTWSSLTSNKYQGFSSTITGAEFEVRAYGNNDVVLLNYDNTEPTYDNPPATDNPLLKAPSQASIGGTLESDLIWTLTDVVPTDNDHINLLATFENVVWNKRAGLPTADDVQPNITQFEIPLTFFTDTNGTSGTSDDICVKTAASAACDTSTIQLPLTNPQILNYARASIPEQVDASANNARIPVQLEVLTGVTNVSGSDDIYDFTLHNAESLMDNAVISGLDHSGGACTIGSDCIAIANSADGSLRNIADDSSNLTQGEGTLSISSGADLSGILEAELTLPDSLHWFWDDVDGDGNLDLIAPSTFIIFGDYQGKAPILFIQPGFR